ncbi:Valine-trna ligase [Mycena venus]|uniref:Valine-trna ligase n=1 Tax=Mycena venus TaxID=2733690 RepID=A0A8H7CQW6_9AGAR|nr:Valine-trna ligase [Mycena venus]
MSRNYSRHSLFTIWFLLLWSTNGNGLQVNVTVDDFDPSIVYTPANSWNSSTVVCAVCDNPPVLLASQQTYHKGVHVDGPDADDSPPISSAAPPAQQPSTPASEPSSSNTPSAGNSIPPLRNDPTPTTAATKPPSTSPPAAVSKPPPPPPTALTDPISFNHTSSEWCDDKSGKKSGGRRDTPRFSRSTISPVSFDSLTINSTIFIFARSGTAIYIFCIQPLGMSTPPAPPSLMNVTFSVDNVTEKPFIHQGSPSDSGFASRVNVFAKQGLSDGQHVLKINLAPNSVFILDYMLVTKNETDIPAAATANAPAQSQLSTPSSDDATTTKSGRASFAGAVAGSLGVLGILCFGTAFSIYRRRRLAARRERLERGNAPAPRNMSMSGPAPFVPRYFPGTVVPSVPPPYVPSDPSSSSTSSHASSLAAISEPLLATHPEPTSYAYADIAPPLDDIAPPSFGVAITTPAVTLLSSSDVASPPSAASQLGS